jgi:hypothetical protein
MYVAIQSLAPRMMHQKVLESVAVTATQLVVLMLALGTQSPTTDSTAGCTRKDQ